MKLFKLPTLSLFLLLCMVGVACNDSSTGPGNSSSATFEGRVENSSSSKTTDPSSNALEGAVVTAAQVDADGSLQTIGSSQAETNADGEFTLKVDVSSVSDSSGRIIIIANKGNETAKTVVSSKIENGGSYTVKPITFETTAEADVYQKVVANGDADAVTKADIEIAVQSNVAGDIESNSENAAKVAETLASSADAKAKFYSSKAIDISNDQKEQIMQAKQEAAVQYESQLNAVSSAQEQQDAYDAFIDAVAHAELDAGVEAWAVAESNDFAANVLLHGSADLSSEAQSELRQAIYYYTAVAVDAGAQAEAKAAGASDNTINAIADAGATLQSDIKTATNASEQAVTNAFVKFNEDVQTAIIDDTSLEGSAFVSVNTAISGSSGLKNSFEQSLSATTNLDTMLEAYNSFSTSVETLLGSKLTDASEAEVQTYMRLLVLVNVAS